MLPSCLLCAGVKGTCHHAGPAPVLSCTSTSGWEIFLLCLNVMRLNFKLLSSCPARKFTRKPFFPSHKMCCVMTSLLTPPSRSIHSRHLLSKIEASFWGNNQQSWLLINTINKQTWNTPTSIGEKQDTAATDPWFPCDLKSQLQLLRQHICSPLLSVGHYLFYVALLNSLLVDYFTAI